MTWFQVFYKTMTFQISTLHTDTLSTRQLEGLIDWVFIGVLEELFTSWCVEWASEVLTGSKIFALPTKDLPKPNQSNRLTGYLPTFINHNPTIQFTTPATTGRLVWARDCGIVGKTVSSQFCEILFGKNCALFHRHDVSAQNDPTIPYLYQSFDSFWSGE